MSSLNVSCHVLFGLPHLLVPPSRAESTARVAGLDVMRCSTGSMNLLHLTATVFCRLPMPALQKAGVGNLFGNLFIHHMVLSWDSHYVTQTSSTEYVKHPICLFSCPPRFVRTDSNQHVKLHLGKNVCTLTKLFLSSISVIIRIILHRYIDAKVLEVFRNFNVFCFLFKDGTRYFVICHKNKVAILMF